jgi:large subunit GTPase 1
MTKSNGGQGKGKPKLKDRCFGKALIRQHATGAQGMHGRKAEEVTNMISILENTTLDDYINSAEMDGGGVEVRRVHNHDAFLVDPTSARTTDQAQRISVSDFEFQHLSIPRKPSWSKTMTAEDIDRREKDAFLHWRRQIANIESANDHSKKVTPFEKNIEVWRQLWRVVDRSDLIVQIVDARNPLLYYTQDLMNYVSELSPPKPMMLLINKADFLSDYQRECWVSQLHAMGMKFAFYSAKTEQNKIDEEATAGNALLNIRRDGVDEDDDGGHVSSSSSCNREDVEMLSRDLAEKLQFAPAAAEKPVSSKQPKIESKVKLVAEEDVQTIVWGDGSNTHTKVTQKSTEKDKSKPSSTGGLGSIIDNKAVEEEEEDDRNVPLNAAKQRRRVRVLTREELILLLELLPSQLGIERVEGRNKNRVCIGMVGYPNVGKSSVINTILGVSKSSHGVVRVGVSSTPGKTKHFQTLMVSEDIMLCDCPGLVFPSFMRSTGLHRDYEHGK